MNSSLHQAEPRPGGLRWKLFGASSLLLLSLPLVLAVRGLSRPELASESILPFIPNGPQLASRFDAKQAAERCFGTLESQSARSQNPMFRFGVFTLDVATFLRAEDLPSASRTTERMADVLEVATTRADLSAPLASLQQSLESSPPQAGTPRRALRQLERQMAETGPTSDLLLGKWVGAGYAALAVDAEIFFKSRHWDVGLDLLEDPSVRDDLRKLGQSLRSTSSGDLTSIRTQLDETCRLLGEGPASSQHFSR